jgi:hypothetical protein
MAKPLGQIMVRGYFTERGPYKVVHISKSGSVHFEKEDGELYYRNQAECRFVKRLSSKRRRV